MGWPVQSRGGGVEGELAGEGRGGGQADLNGPDMEEAVGDICIATVNKSGKQNITPLFLFASSVAGSERLGFAVIRFLRSPLAGPLTQESRFPRFLSSFPPVRGFSSCMIIINALVRVGQPPP